MNKFLSIVLIVFINNAFAENFTKLHDYLFNQTESFSGVLEVDGKIIFNENALGFTNESQHLFWSGTKSVIGTLVGIAINENKLHWGDSICNYIPKNELKDEKLCKVTIEHLMYWQSGIEWEETYEKGVAKSDVIEMLFGDGARNMASFVSHKVLSFEPGSKARYSSGDTVLLSYVLRKVYSENDYENLIKNKLATPLGLNNFILEKDKAGTYVGSSYLYSSALDMVKFADLFLNKGKINNKAILGEDFINKVTQHHPSFIYPNTQEKGEPLEGGHWWLNQTVHNKELPWPDLPNDSFAAMGHWGQVLLIIPSKKIVFVRTGDDRKKEKFSSNQVGILLKEMGVL